MSLTRKVNCKLNPYCYKPTYKNRMVKSNFLDLVPNKTENRIVFFSILYVKKTNALVATINVY